MNLTQEMLNVAMKKAVELGVFPKHPTPGAYIKNWDAMKACLEAALTDGLQLASRMGLPLCLR